MNKKMIYMTMIYVMLFIATISFTYAFFSISLNGDGKENVVTAGSLSIEYVDGQEIILDDAYPGDNITKTVTVTNTGTFDTSYDIIYKDLINEFINDELVVSYTCTSYTGYVSSTNKGQVSGNCNSVNEVVVPYSESAIEEILSEDISISEGITHEYMLTITFKEIGVLQNYNKGKHFSTKINISESSNVQTAQGPWYESCSASSNNLNCKIITAQTPSSDENIDFAQKSSDTNGNGLYYTSNLNLTEDYDGDGTGDRVYYYRGAVENNNVRFGGYCWRIVRTNEDGSVRLRYNGEYSNGTCPVTGTDVKINNSDYAFNGSYNNEKYNEYIWEDGTGESLAKTTIDAWYTSSGLVNYANQIANVPYCADKSNPVNDGYLTFYGAANRLVDITTFSVKSDAQPTYKCADIGDKHTVSGDSWGGNGKLSKPIGLLTADEVAFAGGIYGTSNSSYYLYTSTYYWTISPFRWTSGNGVADSFFVYSTGGLGNYAVDGAYGLLPAVSLKAGTMVNAEGDGTYTNPYVVES